jgi:hypothetical protein
MKITIITNQIMKKKMKYNQQTIITIEKIKKIKIKTILITL